MNYFGAVSLANGVVALLAGLYPLLRDRRNPLYLAFSAFAFSVALWAIFYAVWQSQISREPALFFMRLLMMPTYCIPSSFLWFVLTLLEAEVGKLYRVLLAALPLVFLSFSLSGLMVGDVAPRLYFPFWPVPGPLMHVFVAVFLGVLSHSFLLLFRAWRRAQGLRRWQLRWVTLSMLFAFLGGATNWFLWYGIPLPPIPNFLVGVFLLILAYAIIRRQLFDVDALADYVKEARLSALGVLAAGVLHEIRTPLFVASGHAESLARNLKQGPLGQILGEDQKNRLGERLAAITSQIERAVGIAKRFSEFSKSRNSHRSGENVSIRSVLDDVLSWIGGGFETEKIQVKIELDRERRLLIPRGEFEEILINLLTNAYQAMPGGGTLAISEELKDGRIRLRISDTGGGIPAGRLKHLFEPFATFGKEEGTGLGLYLVKRLTERNGGKVKVQSEAGKGTTFLLEFPVPDQKRCCNERYLT